MSSTLIHTIYTIGHSTHTLEEFLEMLHSFGIKMLVDIRRLPGSGKYPQFDQNNLEVSLPENGITYKYLKDLGGRRTPKKDSENTRWRNASFRGYADYMETAPFKEAIKQLEEIASQQTTAIMCAEAVWWRCHRSMVADYLKAEGWMVWHIMGVGIKKEHPYTQPARIIDGHLTYAEDH